MTSALGRLYLAWKRGQYGWLNFNESRITNRGDEDMTLSPLRRLAFCRHQADIFGVGYPGTDVLCFKDKKAHITIFFKEQRNCENIMHFASYCQCSISIAKDGCTKRHHQRDIV